MADLPQKAVRATFRSSLSSSYERRMRLTDEGRLSFAIRLRQFRRAK
jgi:hypothetical protein